MNLKRILIQLLLAAAAFGASNSGSISAASAVCVPTTCVWTANARGTSADTIQISGTFAATLQFEASLDRLTWTSITGYSATGAAATSATTAGIWRFNVAGLPNLRVRASAFSSGPVKIDIASANPVTTGDSNWTRNGTTLTPANGGDSVATPELLTNVEYSNGTCTTAATIDPAHGNRQKVTLTNAQTCALTFTQPTGGTASIQLAVIQSAAGSFNGLISGGKWPGGSVPVITATTGAVDILSCYLDGTSAYCGTTQDFR